MAPMPIEIGVVAMVTFSFGAAELLVKLANSIANRIIRFLAFMVINFFGELSFNRLKKYRKV